MFPAVDSELIVQEISSLYFLPNLTGAQPKKLRTFCKCFRLFCPTFATGLRLSRISLISLSVSHLVFLSTNEGILV